ncbi:uncharacterized protein LOC135942626 [Cloeon dipterum]|uniref:uncharacterized protein LOC135942626 n=1 Tax=Cloeon dipterum TaxID=197152 RepID=UPI0032201E88
MMDVVKIRKASAIFLLMVLTMSSVGATFEFENPSISNWKLMIAAKGEENIIKLCRYNATLHENNCKTKEELLLMCGCIISHTENEVNLNCHSLLADCPQHLSLTFQQGSKLSETAASKTPIVSWVVYLSLAFNVIFFLISFIVFLIKRECRINLFYEQKK